MHRQRHFTIVAITLPLVAMLSACDWTPREDARALSENTSLPDPITIAESIPAHSNDHVCAQGGIRLVYGLDHDANGTVGPYESIGMEYLCNPDSKGETGPRVVFGSGIPKADRDRLLELIDRS